MAKKETLLRRWWHTISTIEGVYSFFASEFVRPWLWPAVTTAVTFLSGLITPIPLPYLFGASALTFAAVSTGIIRIAERKERSSPGGKLVIEGPVFYPGMSESDGIITFAQAILGIRIKNFAGFPIHVYIEKLDTAFANKVNMNKKYTTRQLRLEPYSADTVADDNNTIKRETRAKKDGKLSCLLKYGRDPDKLKYTEKAEYEVI